MGGKIVNRKLSLAVFLVMLLQLVFGAAVMAETSYPLTDKSGEVTTRYVEFTESNGNVIASTTVSDISKSTNVALILTEYRGDVVCNTKIDRKTLTEGADFSVSLPKIEGSVYKAYVWNYTSLTPYTNVAEYPSADVSLEKIIVGNVEIDTSVKEYSFNTINNDEFPLVTGIPVNNGTKVTVKVSSDTVPGAITIIVESSDGIQKDEIVINFNDITHELHTWLESVGIDVVDITTYVIKEGDL